jgi:hypothetical protein
MRHLSAEFLHLVRKGVVGPSVEEDESDHLQVRVLPQMVDCGNQGDAGRLGDGISIDPRADRGKGDALEPPRGGESLSGWDIFHEKVVGCKVKSDLVFKTARGISPPHLFHPAIKALGGWCLKKCKFNGRKHLLHIVDRACGNCGFRGGSQCVRSRSGDVAIPDQGVWQAAWTSIVWMEM